MSEQARMVYELEQHFETELSLDMILNNFVVEMQQGFQPSVALDRVLAHYNDSFDRALYTEEDMKFMRDRIVKIFQGFMLSIQDHVDLHKRDRWYVVGMRAGVHAILAKATGLELNSLET